MKSRTDLKAGFQFPRLLEKWNRLQNNRQMPWKGEKDPYKIWLSEIILQQTRVEQGLDYYERFIKSFPTVHELASADDKAVYKLWEGLGYYTRCKNLLATARYISKELNGKFPDTYDQILKLTGVGVYTAAAISSFAYNLPHAVIDGNVFRVLARIFGIGEAVDTVQGKKIFFSLAGELLDKKQPGIYNQAMMDFGAVVCKPSAPLCPGCIFKNHCFAYQHGKVAELPLKAKKNRIRNRWFNYLILTYKNEVLIRERTEKEIWRHLYEFNLIETKKQGKLSELLKTACKENIIEPDKYKMLKLSPVIKQQLSHQLIRGQFVEIELLERNSRMTNGIWVKKQDLVKYPFPRFINQYLKQLFD